MIATSAKIVLGIVGAAVLADGAIPEPFAGIVQFGALGLCAYMVLMNERDRRRMSAALDKKEQAAAEERQRLADVLERKEEASFKRHTEEAEKLAKLHLETIDAIRKCQKE